MKLPSRTGCVLAQSDCGSALDSGHLDPLNDVAGVHRCPNQHKSEA